MINEHSRSKQVLLTIVTLGVYAVYWFYATSKEIVECRSLPGRPRVWALMQIIPLVNLYPSWKYSRAVQAITDGNYKPAFTFLLSVIFFPAAVWITQGKLNEAARRESKSRQEGLITAEPERFAHQAAVRAS